MNIHTQIEQLEQLKTVTCDGNLIASETRDQLVKNGLVERAHGWNWITAKGVEYLVTLGSLRP